MNCRKTVGSGFDVIMFFIMDSNQTKDNTQSLYMSDKGQTKIETYWRYKK